jgi:SAM-dependent methyltransferase
MGASPSAEEWDRRYAGGELLWSATPNRFVAEALADVDPGRALDLAAGEGRNAVWLAERGWEVTAVDFSPAGLEKGRELAAARGVEVEWIGADLARWTAPAGLFDAVVLAYLHVDASLLRQVLGQAAAALAPGGRLVVVGHDRDNLAEGWGGPQEPAILYSLEHLTGAVPTLQIERADRVQRPVDTPEGERTAIDALMVARRT